MIILHIPIVLLSTTYQGNVYYNSNEDFIPLFIIS